jgi:hypothetical protein
MLILFPNKMAGHDKGPSFYPKDYKPMARTLYEGDSARKGNRGVEDAQCKIQKYEQFQDANLLKLEHIFEQPQHE